MKPGEVLPDATAFWTSIPDRPRYGGGHILTGPVYVEGAEPGDTLEVQILRTDLRVPYGLNGTTSTSGVFGTTYPGYRTGDAPLGIPTPPDGAVAASCPADHEALRGGRGPPLPVRHPRSPSGPRGRHHPARTALGTGGAAGARAPAAPRLTLPRRP